jgi:hypothetical protein
MSNHLLWQRLGAASGIVYVVVLLGPDLIQGGPSEEPTMTVAEAIVHSCAITTAAQPTDAVIPILHTLGFLFFLFFLGSLWSALRRAEGDDGWLSAAAFGGGLASFAIKFASGAFGVAASRNACAGIDPQLWQVLQDMNSASFFLSFLPLTALVAASAVMAIRFGAPLPRWLGGISAVVAVALLVDGMAGTLYPRDFGPSFLLFMLWMLAASIALMRSAGVPHSTVGNAAVAPPSVVS